MKTGIVRIGYAPLTFSQLGDPIYSTPIYFADAAAGAREYSAEPKGDVHAVWANSQLVYQGVRNSGYDISLTLIDIIDDIAKSWYGDLTRTTDGVVGLAEEGKAVERPRFALIISEETTDDAGVTHIFFNCCAGKKPTINGKTAEDGDWDDQFPEYNITASAVKDSDGKYWVRADIPGTNRLTAVTTPVDEPVISEAPADEPANPGTPG